MSDHESDDERLAAFLDGRMDARGREEMLAHLTRSEEERAVLMRTAAILRQLEEEDAAAPEPPSIPQAVSPPAPEGVIELNTRRSTRSEPEPAARRTRARVLPWVALAAVLACVAVATGVLRPRSSAGEEPVRLAARLESGAEGLPPRWIEEWPWISARGDGPGGDRVATSARAGAMLVDLAVAVEAGDREATEGLATRIAARFGRSGALSEIADSAGASPERLRTLVGEATEQIENRLDRDALRLGAWTEAARLAAARRDAAFFRDDETRRSLDQAGRLTEADPAAHAAVEPVRRALAADPPRWEALASALDEMLREIASE